MGSCFRYLQVFTKKKYLQFKFQKYLHFLKVFTIKKKYLHFVKYLQFLKCIYNSSKYLQYLHFLKSIYISWKVFTILEKFFWEVSHSCVWEWENFTNTNFLKYTTMSDIVENSQYELFKIYTKKNVQCLKRKFTDLR